MSDIELLNRLHDIQAPAAPGWWPPAPGWWLLLMLALLLPVLLGKLRNRYQRHRRRRQILEQLDRLQHRTELDDARFTAALSILLKRAALLRHARCEIATLYGPEWLRFLDASGDCDGFTRGPGQVLASVPYQPQAQIDRPALTALARSWLQRNL